MSKIFVVVVVVIFIARSTISHDDHSSTSNHAHRYPVRLDDTNSSIVFLLRNGEQIQSSNIDKFVVNSTRCEMETLALNERHVTSNGKLTSLTYYKDGATGTKTSLDAEALKTSSVDFSVQLNKATYDRWRHRVLHHSTTAVRASDVFVDGVNVTNDVVAARFYETGCHEGLDRFRLTRLEMKKAGGGEVIEDADLSRVTYKTAPNITTPPSTSHSTVFAPILFNETSANLTNVNITGLAFCSCKIHNFTANLSACEVESIFADERRRFNASSLTSIRAEGVDNSVVTAYNADDLGGMDVGFGVNFSAEFRRGWERNRTARSFGFEKFRLTDLKVDEKKIPPERIVEYRWIESACRGSGGPTYELLRATVKNEGGIKETFLGRNLSRLKYKFASWDGGWKSDGTGWRLPLNSTIVLNETQVGLNFLKLNSTDVTVDDVGSFSLESTPGFVEALILSGANVTFNVTRTMKKGTANVTTSKKLFTNATDRATANATRLSELWVIGDDLVPVPRDAAALSRANVSFGAFFRREFVEEWKANRTAPGVVFDRLQIGDEIVKPEKILGARTVWTQYGGAGGGGSGMDNGGGDGNGTGNGSGDGNGDGTGDGNDGGGNGNGGTGNGDNGNGGNGNGGNGNGDNENAGSENGAPTSSDRGNEGLRLIALTVELGNGDVEFRDLTNMSDVLYQISPRRPEDVVYANATYFLVNETEVYFESLTVGRDPLRIEVVKRFRFNVTRDDVVRNYIRGKEKLMRLEFELNRTRIILAPNTTHPIDADFLARFRPHFLAKLAYGRDWPKLGPPGLEKPSVPGGRGGEEGGGGGAGPGVKSISKTAAGMALILLWLLNV